MADPRGIRAGRAFVELGVDDKIAKGLRKAEQRLKAFGEGLRALGTRVFAAGAAALTPLLGAVKAFSDSGDTLEKMSSRTGVSVEALSELGFAAEQSGADLEMLETGLRKMQRTIADAATGSESAVEALGHLGLTVEDVLKLNPEQQFKLIADRLSKISDPTLRAALALELFGKSGTRLLPLIQDGAKGLDEYQRQARALGLTVSTETAKDAALLDDALRSLWRVLKQSAFTIGAALSPTISELAGKVTRAVVAFSEWVKQNKALVVTVFWIAVGVAAAGAALIALGAAASALGAALGGLRVVFSAVGTALLALRSPIRLVIAAVAALGTAILVYTGAGRDALAWLGEQFRWLKEGVRKVVAGISDALAAGDITLAAQILWLGLKLAWQQGVDALNRIWLEAKRFFIGTVQVMWFGALAAAQQAFHALEIAWIETSAFLSKTWTNFTSYLRQAWGIIQNWLISRWLDLMNLFGQLTDEQAEAARRMADLEFVEGVVEIERRRKGALTEREQRRQREREQSAAINEATLAEIGRQFEEAQQELDADTVTQIAETRRQLAEASKALGEALAEAKRRREEAGVADGPPRRRATDPLAGLEDQLAGLGDLRARKISVVGTFNPLAVAGLGGGDAEERTARNTEQIARHTKRLAEMAGRLTFA